jgi:hypothetical protein
LVQAVQAVQESVELAQLATILQFLVLLPHQAVVMAGQHPMEVQVDRVEVVGAITVLFRIPAAQALQDKVILVEIIQLLQHMGQVQVEVQVLLAEMVQADRVVLVELVFHLQFQVHRFITAGAEAVVQVARQVVQAEMGAEVQAAEVVVAQQERQIPEVGAEVELLGLVIQAVRVVLVL